MSKWRLIVAASALSSIVVEVAFHDAAHAPYWWHQLPAFDLGYGLVGCLAIIVLSKALGQVWLQRPESYYETTDFEGKRRP